MVVVDASVVVAGLASADATGKWAESVLAGEPLAAPHLMPVEAASILHRAVLAGEISADAASLAHADLGRLRVEYFSYEPFADRIWELRARAPAAPPTPPQPVRLALRPGALRTREGTDDPAEMLGDSLEQQVKMLQRIRRGLTDLRTARRRVESQLATSAQSSDELQSTYESLRHQEDRLMTAAERLQEKIDARRQLRSQAAVKPGRPDLTCYQAWYVALAEFLGVKLATLDAGLARVPGPRCGFCLPPV
jgi:predicted nucleic acid-binding protein